MKTTKILTVGVLLLGITFVKAQNTFPANGNVGIGTATPWTTLQVHTPDLTRASFLSISGTAPGIVFSSTANIGSHIPAIGLSTNTGHYFGNAIAGQFNIRGGIGGDIVLGNLTDAQSNGQELMRIKANGNVGIGTAAPIEKLEVNGNLKVHGSTTIVGDAAIQNNLVLHGSNSWIMHTPDDGRTNLYLAAYTNGAWDWSKSIYFKNDGTAIFKKIGIGTDNPDQELTVKGKIHAEEIIVDLQVPADYVFEKYYTGSSSLKADYKMLTLAEVEQYTKANNHLPNIPSATEIKEKGLQVGEMSNILLQKIEELTLYTIEQQKRIEALEAKLSERK